MNISTTDGTIRFARGEIRPDTTRASFLVSKLGQGAEIAVANWPWTTYRIRPEKSVGATLTFNEERLAHVSMAIVLPDEIEDEWSVDLETRRKQVHDRWLAEQLGGPPYRYSWGDVASLYDDKGCASDIIVTYAK